MKSLIILKTAKFRVFLNVFAALSMVFLSSPDSIEAGESEPAQGLWDAKLNLVGRTYPIGAQFQGTAGYSHRLWGDTATWKYGYIRAAANLATSVVINRVGGELQFFPISIVGISAGYDLGVRNFTMRFLDCSLYACNGILERRFIKLNAVGAYQGVIFSFLMRYENIRAPEATKPLFDEVTLLVGRASGEDTITLNPALLYTIDSTWKVGATSIYSRAVDTGGYTNLYGPVVSWARDEWNIFFGAGLNRSPVVHSGFAGFFSINYAFAPSLSINDMELRNRN
jgi:hypothetical protein